ncbi:MAG: hypothetical protein ACXVW8_04790 [Nocardioidaceae bacterium]
MAGIDAASSCWEDVIGAEPSLTPFVGGDDLDAVLEAMADLVDMKSPWMSGHSRGVANLALEAGRIPGLADNELSALHRAESSTTWAGSASPMRSGTNRGR